MQSDSGRRITPTAPANILTQGGERDRRADDLHGIHRADVDSEPKRGGSKGRQLFARAETVLDVFAGVLRNATMMGNERIVDLPLLASASEAVRQSFDIRS